MLTESLDVLKSSIWFQSFFEGTESATFSGADGHFEANAVKSSEIDYYRNLTGVSYPFLAFEISIFASAGSSKRLVFSLGGLPLWTILFDSKILPKVTQAFQLTTLGYCDLEEALEQTLLAVDPSEAKFTYDKTKSILANYFDTFSGSFFPAPPVDFTGQEVKDLVQFLNNRLQELAVLSQLDYSIPDMADLDDDTQMLIRENPFFFAALTRKKDVFSIVKTMRTGDVMLSRGVITLPVQLGNYSSGVIKGKEAVALNALELSRQNSKAGFIYDLLRIKDGGEYFDGEEAPDPVDVLRNVGLADLVGEKELAEIASSVGSLKSSLFDRLIAPTVVEEEVYRFEPSIKKRFKSLSDFWTRFCQR